jgi:hypothetical protein
MRKSTKITAIVAGSALSVATAGAAYAYWTTTGSGAGSATAAASNGTLALHADAVSAAITPGSNYSVPIMADNGGTTDLVVNRVSTVISSPVSACQTLITAGTSGLSFANVDTSGVTVLHNSTNTVIGTGSLVWANSSTVDQSACKSAGIVLTFSGS